MKISWDEVAKKYKTGKYSQQELADMYGVVHSTIGRKIREMNIVPLKTLIA